MQRQTLRQSKLPPYHVRTPGFYRGCLELLHAKTSTQTRKPPKSDLSPYDVRTPGFYRGCLELLHAKTNTQNPPQKNKKLPPYHVRTPGFYRGCLELLHAKTNTLKKKWKATCPPIMFERRASIEGVWSCFMQRQPPKKESRKQLAPLSCSNAGLL